MPLGPGVRYRVTRKGGSKVRLAFKGSKVIEAKNLKTGATHTPAEFEADAADSKDKPCCPEMEQEAKRRMMAKRAMGGR